MVPEEEKASPSYKFWLSINNPGLDEVNTILKVFSFFSFVVCVPRSLGLVF